MADAARRGIAALPVLLALGGCAGVQSALDPSGAEAEWVATLFWIMVAAAAMIWLGVMAMLLLAIRRRKSAWSEAAAGRLVLWAGAVFPTIVLIGLVSYVLAVMPSLRPLAALEREALSIHVVGKQFWWDVTYRLPDGSEIRSANEVRLPVGERVAFTLESTDVIHAFWIPALGGKMDMVPGRTTRFSLEATKPGVFRGPCTEFCGPSHALMAFAAEAMPAEAFGRWLEKEAGAAGETGDPGLEAFLANGCGACHTIRGTEADGTAGPDLTRLGQRHTIGAGILPNDAASIARFIARPDELKPGVRMPAYDALPAEEIEQIARYLEGLE